MPEQVDHLLAIENKIYALANDGLYVSTQRGPRLEALLSSKARS